MSWAEDNMIDGGDWDFPEDKDPSENWYNGFHVDSSGSEIPLKEMDRRHLLNTINLFEEKCDVTPLKEELRRRELLNANLFK